MKLIDFELPSLEPRLQRRFRHLVQEHLRVSSPLAPGVKALPRAASAFASTQAAWRFFNNPNVSLPSLAEPLLAHGRRALAADCKEYGLVVHDWSPLTYNHHRSKRYRARLQNKKHRGYELQTALLLSDQTGDPLAPLLLNLRTKQGCYSTRWERTRPRRPRLEELTGRLQYLAEQPFARPLVHIIDREADSVGHYRRWAGQGRRFLVRAKGRQRVEWGGRSCLLRDVVPELAAGGAFQWAREVDYKGRKAQQYVAETQVVLSRPARPKRRGKSSWVSGAPLSLRLVVSQVRSTQTGQVLATWLLLSNVPAHVPAAVLALWYYWRWRVESLFKLLKSAGHQVQAWQQETGAAVARRLLVASMACMLVWQLARDPSPAAAQSRELLVRLSGRQMKAGHPWTLPALLDGMWVLLAILDLLEHGRKDHLKNLLRKLDPLLGT